MFPKEGDIIIYSKEYTSHDDKESPLWGGRCGKIKGVVISISDKEYIKKFGGPDLGFPIKVKWENGEINGYKESWIPHFTIIGRKTTQLNLFS